MSVYSTVTQLRQVSESVSDYKVSQDMTLLCVICASDGMMSSHCNIVTWPVFNRAGMPIPVRCKWQARTLHNDTFTHGVAGIVSILAVLVNFSYFVRNCNPCSVCCYSLGC